MTLPVIGVLFIVIIVTGRFDNVQLTPLAMVGL